MAYFGTCVFYILQLFIQKEKKQINYFITNLILSIISVSYLSSNLLTTVICLFVLSILFYWLRDISCQLNKKNGIKILYFDKVCELAILISSLIIMFQIKKVCFIEIVKDISIENQVFLEFAMAILILAIILKTVFFLFLSNYNKYYSELFFQNSILFIGLYLLLRIYPLFAQFLFLKMFFFYLSIVIIVTLFIVVMGENDLYEVVKKISQILLMLALMSIMVGAPDVSLVQIVIFNVSISILSMTSILINLYIDKRKITEISLRNFPWIFWSLLLVFLSLSGIPGFANFPIFGKLFWSLDNVRGFPKIVFFVYYIVTLLPTWIIGSCLTRYYCNDPSLKMAVNNDQFFYKILLLIWMLLLFCLPQALTGFDSSFIQQIFGNLNESPQLWFSFLCGVGGFVLTGLLLLTSHKKLFTFILPVSFLECLLKKFKNEMENKLVIINRKMIVCLKKINFNSKIILDICLKLENGTKLVTNLVLEIEPKKIQSYLLLLLFIMTSSIIAIVFKFKGFLE
jgi:hypothetical protein